MMVVMAITSEAVAAHSITHPNQTQPPANSCRVETEPSGPVPPEPIRTEPTLLSDQLICWAGSHDLMKALGSNALSCWRSKVTLLV